MNRLYFGDWRQWVAFEGYLAVARSGVIRPLPSLWVRLYIVPFYWAQFTEGHGGGWRRRRRVSRVSRVAELGLNRKGLAVAGEFGVVLQLETNQRGLASAGMIGGQQMERQRRWRGCGTMLDGEPQAVGPAGEIEVGIAPGPEVAAAAQRLAGKGGAAFAGMMDEEDGGVEGDSQFAQCGENGGDLTCVILILCDYRGYVTTDPLLLDKCSIATELRV